MKIGTRPNKRRMKVRITKTALWYKKGDIYEVGQYTVNNYTGKKPCYEVKRHFYGIRVSDCKIVEEPAKLTIQFIPRTRKGVKYFQIKMSKNGKVFNHQYNSKQGAKKSFESLVNDLKNGNFIVK